VVLSEDLKNDAIDRLKARLREAGVGEHEIAVGWCDMAIGGD
jgi:hypothetical protein